ncbi:TPA: MafI family immunity protein [Neisseria gonorrhoeae]
METLDERIKNLGKSLEDRIDANLIDATLEYITFSERLLAFETLCDYIEDFNIQLMEKESQEISFINKEFGIESTSD